jgi:hypothetical protein
VSAARSGITSDCWVCQAHPGGESSTSLSAPATEKSEVGGVGCCDLAQSSGHHGKQLWQAVVVNHKVRHLEQSFVALQVRVRAEMTFHTQFARAPNFPLGKREDYRAPAEPANAFLLSCSISGKGRGRGLSVWQSVEFRFPEQSCHRRPESSEQGRKASRLARILHQGKLAG